MQQRVQANVLSQPMQLGAVQLSHRIAMAPLTRLRATREHVLTDLTTEYYSQRASPPGTLLIAEATFISVESGGRRFAPGCYTDEQVAAWKRIVEAVHAKGSYIYLQLRHNGRAAKAELLEEDGSKSGVTCAGDISFEGGETPRPLTIQEIKEIVQQFADCCLRFVNEAGGDGIEIHGANGYLIDTFLQTVSNNRTDQYGGSLENRARFMFEVTDAVVKAIGPEKTGIRVSPFSTFQGMRMPMPDLVETFSYVTSELAKRYPTLAFLHVIEPRISGNVDREVEQDESTDFMYNLWKPRPFLTAGGYTPESAAEKANTHENTVIVFGRYYVSNPDLPLRVQNKVAFTRYNRETFYTQGPTGYTDYLHYQRPN